MRSISSIVGNAWERSIYGARLQNLGMHFIRPSIVLACTPTHHRATVEGLKYGSISCSTCISCTTQPFSSTELHFLFPSVRGAQRGQCVPIEKVIAGETRSNKAKPLYSLSKAVGWLFRRNKGLLHVSYCPTISASFLNATSNRRSTYAIDVFVRVERSGEQALIVVEASSLEYP